MARQAKRTRRSRATATTATRAPSDVLNIEVTLVPPPGGLSVVKASERPMLDNLERFYIPSGRIVQATDALARLGFQVTAIGRTALSVRGTRRLFTETFGTELSVFSQPFQAGDRGAVQQFYYPPEGANWNVPDDLRGLIDDAYIQWPPIYFESPLPPRIGYHHLRVPGDMSLIMNADRVHREGMTGRGVRVAMVDTGFYTDHPYFQQRDYNMAVVLAPGATDATRDGNGHGTAECANVLAIAPDVQFIGVKLENEQNPNLGASVAEGFKTAVAQHPDIITVSLGFDLVISGTRQHLSVLPNGLKPLEAEIKAAVQAGIIVIFAAGNGHVAFPGMMPEVISAGGTYVDESLERQASDYASAFESRIYPGRHVPDVTGLVGLVANNGAYIMLPLQPGCAIDRDDSDETSATDGWAVISGTSAAAPQLAGVCALLKQKNPGLTPLDVKQLLQRTARDVRRGNANPASNNGTAINAGPGNDGATGHGLVNAFAAWRQA